MKILTYGNNVRSSPSIRSGTQAETLPGRGAVGYGEDWGGKRNQGLFPRERPFLFLNMCFTENWKTEK